MTLTPKQQYQLRLKSEYDLIRHLPRNDVYTIEPTAGEKPPYVSSYDVTFNIPTIVDSEGRRQERTVVRISLPDNYPQGKPFTTVIDGDVPFHVNWFASGALCSGSFWNPNHWLWEYVNFVGEILQFSPYRTNVLSPANRAAGVYYTEHRSSFPTDQRSMPHPQFHQETLPPTDE